MSLPEYYFLSETALRERAKDPQKFEEHVAELERTSRVWDADGGYAKMIRDARASAADGDETAAETIFLKRLSHMVTRRYLHDKELRKREKEAQEQAERVIKSAAEEEAERRRQEKGKAPMPMSAMEEEAERQRKEKGKAPMRMPATEERPRKRKRKEKKKNRKEVAGFPPKGGRIDFAAIGLDPPPRGIGELITQQNDGAWWVKLVIMKPLFTTDLNPNHNRLSIPLRQVTDIDFLTPREFHYLDGNPSSDENPPGIPVKLIGPTKDVVTDVMLKKWVINKSVSYVLNKGWMSVVRRFPKVFRENAVIQLWTYRMPDGERRFRIHKLGQLVGRRGSSNPELESGSGSGCNRDGGTSSGDSDVSGGSGDGSNGSENETDEGDMSPPTSRRRLMQPPM